MIRRLTKDPRRFRFFAYDLEWYPDSHQLRMIGVMGKGGYKYYTDVESFFMTHLVPETSGARFYAHFGGRFDFVFFIDKLKTMGYEVELYVAGSAVQRATIKKGRGMWFFCDSQFIFKFSLAELGLSIGIQKGECPFDAPLPQLIAYNETDCLILYKAIEWLIKVISDLGGEVRYTIAATGLDLIRRRYLTSDIPTLPTMNKIVRPSYVASRVEVIRYRLDHGKRYDINSSFPYSMAVAPLPGKLLTLDRKVGDYSIFRCDVTVPDMFFPPLPYRVSERVYFPTGAMKNVWLTSADIIPLEASGGRIDTVHESYHFEPFDDLGNYIRAIYKLRVVEKDPFKKTVLKLLMNGAYGKFSERTTKERIMINPKSTSCPHALAHYDKATGISSCMRMIAPGIFAITEEVEVEHAHIPITAFTTARSRAILWDYGSRAVDLSYLDTDCVDSRSDYPSSTELGMLKYEGEFKDAEYIAPKAYRFTTVGDWAAGREEKGYSPDIIRVKGFPRLTRADFDILAGGGGKQIENFRAPKTVMKKGIGSVDMIKFFSSICPVCGRYIRGECRLHPNAGSELFSKGRPKRSVNRDGVTTRPWTVGELDTEWTPPDKRMR